MANSEIQRILISKLKEHPDNPNIHPESQIKAMAQSMEKYGQYYPIICDENYLILCGHGKKKALEYKGEEYAEVRIIKGLSEKQKKKLLIEDNKIQSLSYVNYEKVEDIIKGIGDTDIIGFPTDFVEAIISEVTVDNMGVDFTEKPKVERKASIEKIEEQKEALESIESGMVQANTFTCPHCNKEITL